MTGAAPPVVYILEHDIDVGAMIAAMLDDAGYRTICGRPEPDAMTLIAAARPQVLLLDIDPLRPDVSLRIYNALRGDAQIMPPIIICSTDARLLATLGEQLRSQYDGLLLKPFLYEELLAAVAATTGARQPLNERHVE